MQHGRWHVKGHQVREADVWLTPCYALPGNAVILWRKTSGAKHVLYVNVLDLLYNVIDIYTRQQL